MLDTVKTMQDLNILLLCILSSNGPLRYRKLKRGDGEHLGYRPGG